MADGLLQVGKSTRDGRLNLFRNGSTTHAITLYTTSNGGCVDLFGDAGNRNVWMAADPDGEGGWLRIDRQRNQAGFLVDGNRLDSGNPYVSITGSERSAVFDLRSTVPANDTVKLPADSISSSEILDEPGVASDTGDWWNFASSPMTIASRSITAPANGYVLAIGTVNVWLSQEGTGSTSINIAVSDSERFPSRSANVFVGEMGSCAHPVTHHKLFRVFAGAHTFYLLGTENADRAYVADGELSLIFFPTAYGTVASTSAAPPKESGMMTADGKPDADEKPSAAAQRESPEALQRNLGQMGLELEELKTALAEMQAKAAAMNDWVIALEAALQTR